MLTARCTFSAYVLPFFSVEPSSRLRYLDASSTLHVARITSPYTPHPRTLSCDVSISNTFSNAFSMLRLLSSTNAEPPVSVLRAPPSLSARITVVSVVATVSRSSSMSNGDTRAERDPAPAPHAYFSRLSTDQSFPCPDPQVATAASHSQISAVRNRIAASLPC